MAEAMISSVLIKLLANLNSQALAESATARYLQSEIEAIKRTLITIRSVISYVELKQQKSEVEKDGLSKAVDVTNDAEYLLHELMTEAQSHNQQRKKRVGSSFNFPNPVVRRYKIAEKLKDVREKLDALAWCSNSINGSKQLQNARESEKTDWTLLIANLVLEATSATSDQMGYALIGMVLAFVALALAVVELIQMVPRASNMLPCFRRPTPSSSPTRKPLCTIVKSFGFVSAVWQCAYSTLEYTSSRQKKDNPIKTTPLPFIFVLLVIVFKLKG